MRAVWSIVSVLLCSLPAAAWAQSSLPMGSIASGRTTGETPAVYVFTAEAAGVLSVAVQADDDVRLVLNDGDGQPVPGGTADSDLNGSPGTEILSTTIVRPGEYRLTVELFGSGSASFEIGAGFLAFPPFEQPEDPDGKPGQAQALTIGEPHEDALDSTAGDAWDWFVFTPDQDASLAIVTRALAGASIDLAIEVYLAGDFTTAVNRSDQDQQDDVANEAVTIAVRAGQPVHVKVMGAMGDAVGGYRLTSTLIASPVRR